MFSTMGVGRVLYLVLPALTMCGPVGESSSVYYKNCGPNVIRDVTLGPCNSEPCSFNHGVNVSIAITFVTQDTVNAVTARVYALEADEEVPQALPNSDGCTGCNLVCPLQPGEHTYQNMFPVIQEYPVVSLAIKWELIDENEQQILCFEVPIAPLKNKGRELGQATNK